MFVFFAEREFFQCLARHKVACEVGVNRGEYSAGLLGAGARHLHLVDPWRPPREDELYPPGCSDAAKARAEEVFAGYYAGGMERALEAAFAEVSAKYAACDNVTIIRKRSLDAVAAFARASVDFLYIDANHRFDHVLADLDGWQSVVAADGVIVLNDCYVSRAAKMQFMSVLEAVSQFVKLTDWRVVACNHAPWTDVVLTRAGNVERITHALLANAVAARVGFIELPASAFHAVRHKTVSCDGRTVEFMSFAD